MESFMAAMPLKNLTKTFRDAVNITQNLELDYLWIDALCIIQDSISDWEKESATMSSVYGGSTINIAATGAINGDVGCFLKPEGYVGKVRFTAVIEGREMAWDIAASIFYKSVAQRAGHGVCRRGFWHLGLFSLVTQKCSGDATSGTLMNPFPKVLHILWRGTYSTLRKDHFPTVGIP